MIDFLKNDVWSEADILSHGRTVIASQVSPQRQTELQTIMLGHIAGMRTATAEEMQEIGLVQVVTEAQALANAQARADMALLLEVMDFEADSEGKTLSAEAQAVWDLRHPYVEPTLAPEPELEVVPEVVPEL
jgi:hypothetical protein